MRDIKRIEKIMSTLTKCWQQVPDMRFWQFISYFVDSTLPEKYYNTDLYFLEDDVWQEMANKMEKK